MTRQRIAIIGAGGHAKVIIATLQARGFSNLAVFDDDVSKKGARLLDAPVLGAVADLNANAFDAGVLTVGSNAARKKIAASFSEKNFPWLSVVHPAAWVHESVKIGAGTVVMAGAVVQPDTALGEHVIINTGATVDHDCAIEDFVHIAPGVNLAGAVQVGEGAFVGIGSAAIPGVKIGAWTTVGAGSVIVRDLPENVIAFGAPARPRKTDAR